MNPLTIIILASTVVIVIAWFLLGPAGYKAFFKEFYTPLDSKGRSEFRTYLSSDVNVYYLLEGIRFHGNRFWNKLHVKPGDDVFELGPGHGFLAIKAALRGGAVVAVEHPSSHYLPFLRTNIQRFSDAISSAGGSFTLFEEDILDSRTRERIIADNGLNGFDHVLVVDVLRPGDGSNASGAIAQHERAWGAGTGKPKYGIYSLPEVSTVVEFLVSLKKPSSGTIYINHTSSLERSADKVRNGVMTPDFPFVNVPELDSAIEQSAELSASLQFSENLPTLRNPLDAGTIYHFE